jgi:LmbE family N-acetylglucosaminyl deacetylase
MVSFDATVAGTAAHTWAPLIDSAPPLDLTGVASIVVVAPHPDDETLGAGGLIAVCRSRGIAVTVVVVTDGAAAASSSTPIELARRRSIEVTASVRALNPDAQLTLLGYRDGATDVDRDAIRADLAILVDGADLIVGPWRGDGHRDHRVIGGICATLGVPLVEYPIWMWHWATPDDPRIPRRRLATLEADVDKAAAIALHTSQLGSVLRTDFIEHFTNGRETFITEATTLGADYFADVYSRHDDPWRLESRWYERRKRAITVASLPEERYRTALEVGCSIGVLSAELAERCDDLLAIDVSSTAIDHARARGLETARFEVADAAAAFPSGRFDLIVLSEIGYYLSPADFRALLDDAITHLAFGGTLVACHWRHPVADYPQSGDEVHAAIDLPVLAHHVEDDFVLDVYSLNGRSVARREGLL